MRHSLWIPGAFLLIAATLYLGGNDFDEFSSIAVDKRGNVYVTGGTASSDFPTTPGAFVTSPNGFLDGFVSKLDGDLTTLLASTFLGGNNADSGSSIVIDKRGDVNIIGVTNSSDFPTTPGAFDTSCGTDGVCNPIHLEDEEVFTMQDAFVSKLDPNLSAASSDTDGDGVRDAVDECSDPDLSSTVVIDGCDTGVENFLNEDGCMLSDLVEECNEGTANHGKFVSCVSNLTNNLKKAGIITGKEKGAIQSCAAKADIP